MGAIWRARFGLAYSVLMVVLVTWIATGFLPERYEAIAVIRVDGDGLDALSDGRAAPMGFVDPTVITTRIQALKSKDVMEIAARGVGADYYRDLNPRIDPRILEDDDLKREILPVPPSTQVVLNFEKSVTVNQVGVAGVAEVRVASRDPWLAARGANLVAEAFIEKALRANRLKQLDALETLLRQIKEAGFQLDSVEERILSVRAANDVMMNGGYTSDVRYEQVGTTERLITEAQAALGETMRRLEIIRSVRNAGGRSDALSSVTSSALINALRGDRAILEVEFAQAKSKYGKLHPNFLRAAEALQTVDAAISRELDRIHNSIQNEAQELRGRIANLEERLSETKEEIGSEVVGRVRLDTLESEAVRLRNSLSSFAEQIDGIENTILLQTPEASFIRGAAVPIDRVFPRRKLMAVMAGLGCGAIYAFVVAAFVVMNPRIRTREDIWEFERAAGCNVISALPLLPKKLSKDYLSNANSRFHTGIDSIAAHLGIRPSRNQVVAVSSVESGAGGTRVALALASSVASTGSKTLLIELDGRSRLSSIFGVSGAFGLTNFNRSVVDPFSLIAPTSVFFLDFLPHGNLDDLTDKRGVEALRQVLELVTPHYEAVIINARPLSEAPRAADICREASHTLIVSEMIRSRARAIARHLRSVDALHRKNISLVFNKADPDFKLLD